MPLVCWRERDRNGSPTHRDRRQIASEPIDFPIIHENYFLNPSSLVLADRAGSGAGLASRILAKRVEPSTGAPLSPRRLFPPVEERAGLDQDQMGALTLWG